MKRYNWKAFAICMVAVMIVAVLFKGHVAPAVGFLPLLAGTINDNAAHDPNAYFALDTVRAQYNLLLADWNYFELNGVASTTIATQPACATATTTSKVKTTNATVLWEAGVAVALPATDNYWTLTGGILAAASFRRYLLIDTAGVASVLASNDSTVSAASCRWNSLPANGSAIVGILTVATDASHTFNPGTTLLGAAGITATYIDNHDINVPLAQKVLP